MEDIELEVANIHYPRAQNDAFNLVLKDKASERLLTVLIGLNEAKCIIMEVNHIKMKRPFVYDVLLQLCHRMNFHIQIVLIVDFREGIFYVHIFIHTGQDIVKLDSRLSDAVVLALKSDAPIFITPAVFNNVSFDMQQMDEEEDAQEFLYAQDSSDNEQDEPSQQELDLSSVSDEQLQELLDDALATEDYERAAEIDAELNKRNEHGRE